MKTKLLAIGASAAILVVGSSHLAAANESGDASIKRDMADHIATASAKLLAQCSVVSPSGNADQLPVHITAWGNEGPTVFFVHGGVQGGLGGGAGSFAAQKPLSEAGWQLRLIDRPGFGKSPSRGPDDQEADAALIADSLGTGAHLVGHSWGGAEALLAAARRPSAVRSLILVEPAVHPILQTDPASMQNPEIRKGFEMVARLTLSAPTPAAFATSFARTLGPGNPSSTALQKRPGLAQSSGCALLRGRRASPAALRSAAETVAKAGIPVLIISGGYSVRQDETDEVLARLLRGQHIVIRSPNHFIQEASAEEFNRTIEAFMQDAERDRGSHLSGLQSEMH